MGKGSKKSKKSDRKSDKKSGAAKAGRTKSGKGGSVPQAEVAGSGALPAEQVTPDAQLSGKAAKKAEKKRRKAAKARQDDAVEPVTWSEVLRVGPGFVLADLDPGSTPGFAGDKDDGEEVMAELQARLGDLQERLYAESKGGGGRSVLLVIQGMDTSGKGGIMRHVVGAVDPQGVDITSFKAPSAEEKRHPFLWRIRRALPTPGDIGVFDRSHYEDVLVVRVEDLVPEARWRRRFDHINAFEQLLADEGTTIVKLFLHISKDEQRERLEARLEEPDKHWKFRSSDLDARARWDDYADAFSEAISRTSTAHAPWYVIPADKKWYRDWAVATIMVDVLEAMDLRFPAAAEDLSDITID